MRLIAFFVAASLALLVNYSFAPIVTMSNQLVAVLGWGLVLLLAPAPVPSRATLRAAAPLLAALVLIAIACLASILLGGLPSPPGIGVLGLIVLAGAVALHGASSGASALEGFFRPFAVALAIGGILGAGIACMQIFAVEHVGNAWIALPVQAGRAPGNIGQPNQFADFLVWALIALVPLAAHYAPERSGVSARRAGIALLALFVLLGVALTGSRTALVALGMVAVWGVLDRNLERSTRAALIAAPLLAFAMITAISRIGHVDVNARAGADVTAYRADTWSNALSLIKAQPWTGVGWGQFNFAWTLTPFASRPAGIVDNAHDLPLQLAVELGIPAAALVFGLLLWSVWRPGWRVRRRPGEAGTMARSALMIVLVIGMHSLLEYPLWYAYLLLPAAWVWGVLLGAGAPEEAPPVVDASASPGVRAWRVLGLLMVVTAVSAWMDYLNIVTLFVPTSTSLPLDERIQVAQASPLFSYQADYVAITNARPTPEMLPLVVRSSHVLLNGRLMFLWANMLAAQGQMDKARYLAARLREFDLSGPKPWYAPCDDPAVTVKPFQCLAPEHPVNWRDFR